MFLNEKQLGFCFFFFFLNPYFLATLITTLNVSCPLLSSPVTKLCSRPKCTMIQMCLFCFSLFMIIVIWLFRKYVVFAQVCQNDAPFLQNKLKKRVRVNVLSLISLV